MQFDVHRTPGPMKRDAPFLLVVQSDRVASKGTAIVVPMVPPLSLSHADGDLNPEFTVDRTSVCLMPTLMFTIETHRLGPVVRSLKDYDTDIVRALDIVFSTA